LASLAAALACALGELLPRPLGANELVALGDDDGANCDDDANDGWKLGLVLLIVLVPVNGGRLASNADAFSSASFWNDVGAL